MGDKVALIGVGKMGRALLTRLKLQDHDVAAFDIRDEPMATAADRGAVTCGSSADAARNAAIVHVFVREDQEVLDATLGPDGVLEGAGTGTLVILHATILPETTFKVAEAARARGIDVVDACVTSVPRRLEAGEGTFLMGGPDDLADRARGHLLPLGKAVHHFGPLGSGNVAKIAKNLTNGVERVMWGEVAMIVACAGLDPRQFFEMAKAASHGAMVETWERVVRIEDGEAGARPTYGLFNKDIQHAARLADTVGVQAPVTHAAAQEALRWLAKWADESAESGAQS